MQTLEFTLVLEGEDVLADHTLDALFEAGCDDATFGEVDGVPFADFAREAASAAEAIGRAIRQVESVEGVRVLRVEPDDLVTASDIAARLGRSRESVRLLVAGERGPGGFPPPVSHLRRRQRLWRWTDVARWCHRAAGIGTPEIRDALFVAAVNDALELRHLGPELVGDKERQEVGEILRNVSLVRARRPARARSRGA